MNAPSKAPEINERIGDGRFELLAKLGEGGMSVVYRAHDHLLQAEVALKLLQPRYVGRPEREQRLINEAQYLRRLQGQPHIVEFIDAGRLNEFGWPWLATEVLEGKTLNWQFIAGNLSPDAVLRVAHQVAESLLACHRQGIVNRDPTPTNVFVVNEDPYEIKLFDFSHAADLGGPALEAGMPGRLTGLFDAPGTVGYMGPEQARKAVPDASMDVFGFGALLYELATKQRPYAQFTNRELFLEAQRTEQLEPLRVQAWTYGLPEGIGKLVYECTQRDPTARPTMESIVEQLEKLGAAAPESEEPTERAPKLVELEDDVTAQLDAVAIAKLRSPKDEDDSTEEDETHQLDALAELRARSREGEVTKPLDAAALAELRAGSRPLSQDERTERMDVAAVVGRARKMSRPTADVIGSWTRPPVAMPAATPNAAASAAVAPALGEPELELAFARPPDERPALVIAEPLLDEAPAREDEAAELEPIGRQPLLTGVQKGLLAVVLLGLVSVLAWKTLGSSTDAAETEPDSRDHSPAINHDPPVDPVPSEIVDTGAIVETSGGAEPTPIEPVETTGPIEQPEVAPEPKPKKVHKVKDPRSPNPPEPEPTEPDPTEGDPTNSPECEGVEDAARAAEKKRDWKAVLEQTQLAKCWSSKRDRKRLEVNAYLNLGQWSDCVKAGDGSNDATVQALVSACKESL